MDKTEASSIKIWNPLHAVFWSFLFSPIFGAYIHMKNWKSLKEEKKAKTADYWFTASIAVTAIWLINQDTNQDAATGIFVLFFLVWIFIPARDQIKFFKKLESKPESNEWFKPVGIAVGIIIVVALLVESGIVPNPSNYKFSKQDKSVVSQIVNMPQIEASNKGYFISDRTVIGWKADSFGENHQCILMIRAHMDENKNEFAHRKWDLSITEYDGHTVIGFADAVGGNQQTARFIIGDEKFEATRTNDFFMLKANRKLLSLMASEQTAEAYYGQPTGFRVSNHYLLTDFERGFALTKEVCKQLN